jgi:hypothetical protein
MINVRFDLLVRISDKDRDRTGFYKATLPAVPKVGEVINVKGWPFIVFEVGHSVAEGNGPNLTAHQLWTFVRVIYPNMSQNQVEEILE